MVLRAVPSDKLVKMPEYPLDVFLPAAGFGERLRPATSHLPKPLLPILGTPIIERILNKLARVCDGKIGINLHWKADLLRAWAGASPWSERIVFFPEDPILGTGGALKNAESMLSKRPFIVHNSDILLDIDFARLAEAHLSSGNTATLVCHRLPHLSNVVIESGSQIRDGARVRNCILMPGADATGEHENSIVGPDYEISLAEADMQPSIHAAEKKRVPLGDPLFARHFRAARPGAGRGSASSASSPLWSDAILVGLGGSDRR